VNHWPGQRVYDARTGRYVGTFQGYYGSAYAVVKKASDKPAECVRMDKLRG
jgi:hypothetical protein